MMPVAFSGMILRLIRAVNRRTITKPRYTQNPNPIARSAAVVRSVTTPQFATTSNPTPTNAPRSRASATVPSAPNSRMAMMTQSRKTTIAMTTAIQEALAAKEGPVGQGAITSVHTRPEAAWRRDCLPSRGNRQTRTAHRDCSLTSDYTESRIVRRGWPRNWGRNYWSSVCRDIARQHQQCPLPLSCMDFGHLASSTGFRKWNKGLQVSWGHTGLMAKRYSLAHTDWPTTNQSAVGCPRMSVLRPAFVHAQMASP